VRIIQLNLKAFGPFSNFVLNFENKGFNLVYGLNEAGKTTILRAIRDFFFGFPHTSPDAYLHPSSKLRIEAVLEDSNGNQYQLTRRKGTKNTLLNQEGGAVDESFLQQFLGSLNREFYSLMFGMDHQSLRAGGENLLKGQGSLGEALFEAASGIGSLREVFQELEKEAGELYKPSGSKPPINASIERYREINRKSGELSLAPRKWQELEHKYLEEKKQVEQLQEEEKYLSMKKARLERLKNTLPLLAQRQQHLEEINALSDIPLLPTSFKDRRIELENKRLAAKNLVKQAEDDLEELKKAMEQITVQKEFLEHGGDISSLQERLDTYRNYIQEIPTLQGEKKELQEEALALLRHLQPSLTTLEEAESLRLPLPRAEEIKKLISEYPLLQNNYRTAQKQVKELEVSLQRQEQEKEKAGPQKDASALLKAVNRARKKGEPEKELRKIRSVADTRESKLKSKLDSLGLWSGTFKELLSLSLPLVETVRSFEQEFKEADERIKKINERLEEEEQKLTANQEQLTSGELGADVPTEEKLEEARKHRQFGWHLVRRAWLEGQRDKEEEQAFRAGHPLEVAYEMSVTAADEIADRLRYEASRVERKTIILSEIKNCREKITTLTREKETAEKKQQELNSRWVQAWEKTGITPLKPSEMLPWLEKCQEIIEGIYSVKEERALEKELARAIQEHRDEIGRQLEALGEPGPGQEESLETLLDRAQDIGEQYQAVANNLQSIEKICQEIKDNLASCQRQVNEKKHSLDNWMQQWSAALAEAGLPDKTTVEAAAAYLDRLEALFQKKAEISRKEAALEKMQAYSRDFVSRLQGLVDKLAPDLAEMPADYAASQLQARAAEARQAKDRLDNLEQQLKKVENTDKKAKKAYQEADSGLKELVKQARCAQEEELPVTEEKSERLSELKKNLEGLEKQLLSLGGGLTLEEIIAEAKGVNGDALPGELEEIEQALEENRQARDSLNQVFGVTRREYEEKIEGASIEALEAAEEAQGSLARLQLQVEQYLRLRLASTILRRGIEHYREANQSPVINLAGGFFSRLTNGNFAGLKTDFDEKDNPVIIGLRTSGEEVRVEGMSDGTLDQLYLSLRLSGLERYMEQNEGLPFILDDLLVNFDDIRAEEALKVLGQFAEKTQILFFTHHQSFVNLAEKAIPGSGKIQHLSQTGQ